MFSERIKREAAMAHFDREVAARFPDLYWTGWHEQQSQLGWVGQFLWTGVATFASGRRGRVYYYVSAAITEAVSWNEYVENLAEEKLQIAAARAQQMRDWGRRGFLPNWGRHRPLRPIIDVEWQYWGAVSAEEDKKHGICGVVPRRR